MKYIQSFGGYKIYQTKEGYRAKQGNYWSGLFQSVGQAKQAISHYNLHRQPQAIK